MNTSPAISRALIEAGHRDVLVQAGRARVAREAAQAGQTARESSAAPRAGLRRWWLPRLAGLFGAN